MLDDYVHALNDFRNIIDGDGRNGDLINERYNNLINEAHNYIGLCHYRLRDFEKARKEY